ncbi:carboxypeptidase-like regulatory domain-containing protein [Maribacter algicola]|uniref:Carboxypeptidase-like regulatory domain-containing protein n=1 Tax=Meishania litoralis TaxID=3434685 RepID=A0ACC7LH78_9FLAO
MISISLSAQEKGSVQGKIIDLEGNNEPLLMAEVQIKDTEFKTMTNFNGNFKIEGIEPGSYTMTVRFLGYESIELPVEVTANETVRIESGLKAQTLDLSDISALIFADAETASSVASIEKEQKK